MPLRPIRTFLLRDPSRRCERRPISGGENLTRMPHVIDRHVPPSPSVIDLATYVLDSLPRNPTWRDEGAF